MTAYAIALAAIALVVVCYQWANAIERNLLAPRPPRAYLRKLRANRADLRRALGRRP